MPPFVKAVDAFVEQLSSLIRQAALDSVQIALNGAATASLRGATASRGPMSKGLTGREKGEKRTPEELELLTKKLHAYVSKNPGQRIELVGQALGVATKELALPVKKLIGGKKLSTKGQKRATTYFAK